MSNAPASRTAPALRTSRAPLDLDACRRDLWPRDTLRLAQGSLPPAPTEVAWPEDDAQVELALQRAAEQGLVVVPYGAGSGVCGGASGRSDALVVDLKRMNRVLSLDPDARTVRVQPGVLGQHLEDWLARRGFMTAHSPSSIWCSTVGGYAAARSAGQFSSRYGVFDDMLLAARAQAPTGPILAGAWTPPGQEDLLPVLSGSEGALAVVTEVLLRVAPLPQTRWLRGYAFPNLPTAWSAMRGLLQAGLWPSVVRLYDPLDTRLNRTTQGGRRHKDPGAGGLLSRLRRAVAQVPALQGHLADLPLALPGLVNSLAGGLGSDVALILGFEGAAGTVEAQVELARPHLAAGRDLGPGPGERWFAHRHSVSYKAAPIFIAGGFADTMEVAAPWSRLEALHDAVRAAIGRHGVVMAHFSHVYPEGCSIYFSFAAQGRLQTYDALWSDALDAARAAGGTVTHHHGVGQLKARAAAREAGAAVRVWREVKARLDPDDRMNPGRLFPADEPEAPGPPAPAGGPVFQVDLDSMLAEVDPLVDPREIEGALARRGLAPRIRADRPWARWLTALHRDRLDAWEAPVFAVQARFDDGASARIGPAPRSAAGPDLRYGLLRRAHPELVQIPIRRQVEDAPDLVLRPLPGAPDARDLRPTWRKDERWGFAPELAALAATFPSKPARGTAPRRSPTAHRPQAGSSSDPERP